jgi:hypothetical protein
LEGNPVVIQFVEIKVPAAFDRVFTKEIGSAVLSAATAYREDENENDDDDANQLYFWQRWGP